jgi:hypothetical protein
MKRSWLHFALLLVPALEISAGPASAQASPHEVPDRNVVASQPATGSMDERAVASEAVLREVRLFYRDLAARQWNDVQNHFWPAKVAARWPPPFEDHGSSPADERIARLSARSVDESENTGLCDEPGQRAPGRPAITWAGRWARVVIETCRDAGITPAASRQLNELWLLEFEGVWKIVYLRDAR